MPRAVITITYKHPQGYLISFTQADGRVHARGNAGCEPCAAAAHAVQAALLHGKKGWDILAPREVLECIPMHLRSGDPGTGTHIK